MTIQSPDHVKYDQNPEPSHFTLGTTNLTIGMKIFVGAGVTFIVVLLILEMIYFRRSIFVLSIPTFITLITAIGIIRRDPRLIWPIIGISFFHIFLGAYAMLIFLFYFFFKPLYIIMVLNWAFDTMHPTKTPSFYLSCMALFVALTLFMAFNALQLNMSLRFQNYLGESLTAISNSSATSTNFSTPGQIQGMRRIPTPPPLRSPSSCRMLNKPPIVLANKAMPTGDSDYSYDSEMRCPTEKGCFSPWILLKNQISKYPTAK